MHRAVIFTNSSSWVPAILIKGALAAFSSRDDLELVAVCVPQRPTFAVMVRRHLMNRMALCFQSLFDPALRYRHTLPWPINLSRLAGRLRFGTLFPPEGDINHPQFIARLRNEVRPTIALSFYCPQKFSPDLFEVFSHAVNYHNGLLPKYRGLKATAWSMYHGEKDTGFTFHHMTEDFDEGAILLQDTVPLKC